MRDVKSRCYRFANVEVDVANLRVAVGGEVRALEPKSFRLLVFLVENPGRALTKDEIMAAVWPGAFVSDNSLARAAAQVRKAIDDDPKAPRYVETVPTVGYRFIGECREEGDSGAKDVPEAVGAGSAPEPARGRGQWLRIAAGVCVGLALGGGGWVLRTAVQRLFADHPLRVVSVAKLTSYPGDARDPAVSPDGATVAFSWSGAAGDNYDIYVTRGGGQEPLRLTHDPAPDHFPAWSPDGSEIVFVRRLGQMAQIVEVPPLGGAERVLHEFPRIGADLDFSEHPLLSWSGDGRAIVFSGQAAPGEQYRLYALWVQTGEVRALSDPDAGIPGDSSPALSADGRYLAFVRYLAPRDGKLLIQEMGPGLVPEGKPIDPKMPGLDPRSPVWLRDGEALLFADPHTVYQWEKDKGAEQVYAVDGELGGMALGPERGGTRQLVVAVDRRDQDIWEIPLTAGGMNAAGPPTDLLRSTADDAHPDYSPDGRRITFSSERTGAGEVWVADADGSHPRQVTHLGADVLSYPRWSPDGKEIAFHARVPDVAEVYVVNPDEGAPRQVTHENPGLALATWSRDGRYIYASTLVGGRATTYRIPVGGGTIERLWEGALLKESVDGKYALYWKTDAPGIWRRALAGGVAKNPEELLIPDFWPTNQLGGFEPVAGGVYYVGSDANGKPGPFRYFDYATRRSVEVAPPVAGLGRGFSVAPDRGHMLFAASAEVGGELVSIEVQ